MRFKVVCRQLDKEGKVIREEFIGSKFLRSEAERLKESCENAISAGKENGFVYVIEEVKLNG